MLKRTDLIIPELLTEAIQGQYAGMVALWRFSVTGLPAG